MGNFFTHVLDAGRTADLPPYLQSRVRPTNLICLMVVFALAIPFVIISLMYFPKLAVFPAGGGLVAICVMIINYFGGIYYSRLILPMLLLVLSSLYNAYFSTSIADSVSSIYLVELSFTLIPFVIFDFREKGFLIICTIFSFLIMAVFPLTWQHFDLGYDGRELREGPLGMLTIVLATVFQIACITGLSYINLLSDNRTQRLLSEMNEKNDQMQESRKQLEVNLAQLEEAREHERNRQWIVEGLGKLSDTLRNQDEGAEIYDKIISMVINYVQANQGGIYIADTDEKSGQVQIRLAACYAYGRRKFREQSFLPGEGLLGQAYLEGEYIYLTDVPANYINITSGLGQALPRAVIIVPLKVNDIIEGVIEIASFRVFYPYEIEFMLKLSETLAVFIAGNRNSRQTRMLLEQAQQQGEALRAQEEEMRQNMEELAATQEEMQRNQSELGRMLEESKDREQQYQQRIQELEARLDQKL